ncbi:MAG: putative photosynthetic complex assembly protein PuhE [Anaerolineae bacterium]|jgi:putative photosynthetic complex assembly protein 2|nr:putative photosynthetic complex assembly protein PuhE [Anaerolineae bacterium]
MPLLVVVLPVLYIIFLWWFTTGLIMVVYQRPRWLVRLAFAALTLALVAALAGLVALRDRSDMAGVYLGIACSMIVWGWQVASYYLGFITGQAAPPPPTPAGPRQRFWLALRASLHHELLSLMFALLIAALVWDAANRWGLWLYLTMWLMHSSAKVNIFFGVRNFHIEFLPHHLHHLGALLPRRASNAFFPVSMMVAICIALAVIYQAIQPPADPARTAGFVALAALLILGIVEHWLLVLPLPATLWGWGLRELPPAAPRKVKGQAS